MEDNHRTGLKQKGAPLPVEVASAFCGDTNYIIASESAFHWFSRLYNERNTPGFLKMIRFRRSRKMKIIDKRQKVHAACLVESTRNAGAYPPKLLLFADHET